MSYIFWPQARIVRNGCSPDRIPTSACVLFPTAGQYLFLAPNQYIFHGAEVYSESDDDTSSSSGSDSDESECSADGVEEESEPEEAAAPPTDGETCFRDTIQHRIPSDATLSVQTDSTSEKTESTTHL